MVVDGVLPWEVWLAFEGVEVWLEVGLVVAPVEEFTEVVAGELLLVLLEVELATVVGVEVEAEPLELPEVFEVVEAVEFVDRVEADEVLVELVPFVLEFEVVGEDVTVVELVVVEVLARLMLDRQLYNRRAWRRCCQLILGVAHHSCTTSHLYIQSLEEMIMLETTDASFMN